MTFKAIRKEVKSSSTVSNDTEIRLVLITDDRRVLEIGLDDAETIYTVSITKEE